MYYTWFLSCVSINTEITSCGKIVIACQSWKKKCANSEVSVLEDTNRKQANKQKKPHGMVSLIPYHACDIKQIMGL